MALLEIAGVSRRLGGRTVLDGIDLDVESGEIVALIGRSGSGKSTLLRCIGALDRADSGTIRVDGIDVDDAGRRRELRSRVGMVFQSLNLFPHLSVEGNVTLALRKVQGMAAAEARDRARAMLAKVGIADKAGSYPRALSGGQMQRVAIARSLALEPKLLLLDEVTSALDPETVREVQKVLALLAREGVTMILVTHEIEFALDVSNRLAFLDNGRIAELGETRLTGQSPQTAALRDFLGFRL
jgi:polar amino acid transport system ATP-binding protein